MRFSAIIIAIATVSSEAFVSPSSLTARSHNLQSVVKGTSLNESEKQVSAKDALERTASHLEKLKRQATTNDSTDEETTTLYQSFIQRSANSLKEELKDLGLPRTGRKPDLAKRLVDHSLQQMNDGDSDEENRLVMEQTERVWNEASDAVPMKTFAGIKLSGAAGKALASASFSTPSPVQKAAISRLASGESAILHAETGSGKTLAYLLPVTEQLWREVNDDDDKGFCVIMTPTRELAAQVAGIAQVLAPPDTVRLIFRPTNLMGDPLKEHGEDEFGGIVDRSTSRNGPRLYVGSAKAIMTSLYGDSKMPASPTTKPEAMFFLRNVRWLIMDEVDRLLHVKKSRGDQRYKTHEKPAAVVTSAVARMTLGRAQIVAASATVGRPLRRELSRVLGLSAEECPPIIRGSDSEKTSDDDSEQPIHVGRAVTIPDLVKNYVTAVEGDSSGKLLTAAFSVINKLNKKPRKMLLVLTKGCGMSTKNALGALKHFQCKPEPVSLLDALEAKGSDHMIQLHRQVSGASGVGETNYFSQNGQEAESDGGEYLLVTGEDTVRGLHLDGLDVVIVVGQPHGPDEYTHIAGRTGRAGKQGKVINVVSSDGASHIKSWERMLDVDFDVLDMEDIEALP
jgi:superfamily II DNA/RNA helicase